MPDEETRMTTATSEIDAQIETLREQIQRLQREIATLEKARAILLTPKKEEETP